MNDKFPSILWYLKLIGATVGAIFLFCCLGAWLVYVARRNEAEEEGDIELDQSLSSYKGQQSTQQSSLWGQRQGLLEMSQTSSRSERHFRSDLILSPISFANQFEPDQGDRDLFSDFEIVEHDDAKATTSMLGR